jgi:hypothetical protein
LDCKGKKRFKDSKIQKFKDSMGIYAGRTCRDI